jgi:hypothetical protein
VTGTWAGPALSLVRQREPSVTLADGALVRGLQPGDGQLRAQQGRVICRAGASCPRQARRNNRAARTRQRHGSRQHSAGSHRNCVRSGALRIRFLRGERRTGCRTCNGQEQPSTSDPCAGRSIGEIKVTATSTETLHRPRSCRTISAISGERDIDTVPALVARTRRITIEAPHITPMVAYELKHTFDTSRFQSREHVRQ